MQKQKGMFWGRTEASRSTEDYEPNWLSLKLSSGSFRPLLPKGQPAQSQPILAELKLTVVIYHWHDI